MKSNLRFAAIDIGSNAIRLLFSRIIENELKPHFLIKESLIRMPLRLGKDSFNAGEISEANCKKFLNTMIGFKNLMDAYDPMNYRACATAAMRNAKNGKDLARIVELKTGIKIDIINGAEEAAMILSKNINQYLKKEKSYLHIDVGGGSTELTFIVNGQIENSKSFSIGSVRLLEGKVSKKSWNDMKEWIKNNTNSILRIKAIGSGGNINKIASMLGKKKGEYVPYNSIKILLKKIEAKDFHQRITQFGLRPDRADVIIHASKIYLNCMKWSKAQKILVPQSGLADGIIEQLYDNYKSVSKS
ncbi:exopolyphosphatase [Candidatus Marinimicrobia bacterium]|nr:exopolyphosphatase [Candidatus Neomarinimicrobiota bacterium]